MTEKSPIPGHERTDINVAPFRWIVLIFVVAMTVIQIGVWWIYRYYQRQDASRDVRQTLVEQTPAIPPQPRLQINPRLDLQEFRREQQKILDSYEWISQEQGRVRIPIRRAMEILAERGNAGIKR